MSSFKKIRVIAVDTNGVLLNDVFANSIERFVTERGGRYTAELESIVLGAPSLAGGHALSVACGLPLTAQECIEAFLSWHRERSGPGSVFLQDAAPAFLQRISGLGARVTTYGGRPSSEMIPGFLAPCMQWLDTAVPYVDINDFRPGMKEIARDYFKCECDEILFIDDLSKVANASRALGSGFIGVPSTPHQRKLMLNRGFRHVFNSISEVTCSTLLEVDMELAEVSGKRALFMLQSHAISGAT